MTDLEGRTKDLIIRSDWRHPVASVLRKKLRVTSFRARTCRHPDQIRRRPDETGNERVWNRLLERNRWKLANEKKKRKKNVLCVLIRKHHYRIHAVYSWKFVVSKVGRRFWNNAFNGTRFAIQRVYLYRVRFRLNHRG